MGPVNELIAASRGEIEVDLLLSGAEVADLFSGEMRRTDVAVHKGWITGYDCASAKDVLELDGSILAPGFIDGHLHIESSMVTVPQYAKAVVPLGTTTVIVDPHEIANVWGEAGIRYLLESSRDVPLNVYAMLPSSVPATDLETAGARLDAGALAGLWNEKGVLGLGEVMNFPAVLSREPDVMKKIAQAKGKPVDGHAPGLTGRDLAAYIMAGIRSDHECTTLSEAREKLCMGMYIMLREGSAAKNLRDLLPLVTTKNAHRFIFVSDDKNPADILKDGHIDSMVRAAIKQGLDPIIALRIASQNAAQYFGLTDLGAIAPGYRADIAVLDCLEHPVATKVIKDGSVVAEDGRFKARMSPSASIDRRSMNVGALGPGSFEIRACQGPARVIGVVPHQIITRSLFLSPAKKDGLVVSDMERDILKIAVVERHRATGNVGLGLVQGFGLSRGAIATSVAHDSHNIVAVATSDREMLACVQAVQQMGGGLAVVDGEKVRACLPLPIAGLISEMEMQNVADGISSCIDAATELGCKLEDPFMTLSFLSLPVIPELKLTDRGLVDVGRFRLVTIFGES